jgi:hypothetical protein
VSTVTGRPTFKGKSAALPSFSVLDAFLMALEAGPLALEALHLGIGGRTWHGVWQ